MKAYKVEYLQRRSEIIFANSLKDAENRFRQTKPETQTLLVIQPYDNKET